MPSSKSQWIIALSCAVIALIVATCFTLFVIGVISAGIAEEQRREELLRREPWRQYDPPSERYRPRRGGW